MIINFSSHVEAKFTDQSIAAVEARIAPIEKIRVGTKKNDTPIFLIQKMPIHLGKAIVENHCILCHGSGIAGAPRLGEKNDWKLRSKKKFSLLVNHVENGYHAMPPKGACLECARDDLEAAVRYMLEKNSLH